MNYTTSPNQLKQDKVITSVVIPNNTDFNTCPFYNGNAAISLREFEQYRITECTDIKPPETIISLNKETISTEGNLTTFSGASKSGKSACTGFLIASAISHEGCLSDKLEGLDVAPNTENKAVIHIDTEQARHKHQHNLNSILKRAGLSNCPDYLLSYNIRQLDISEYASITTAICKAASEKFGGIHLIVIDGIADYISDVNDAQQSNTIVKYFEELAIIYSTPIVVIVHTNPGTDKERGHLGSQCQRKSESVITIKTENDISYIEPKLLRNAGKADIPLLQFKYDKEKGYHVPCGIKINDEKNKDIERIQRISAIANEAFSPPASLKYSDAINAIMRYSNKQERTSKDMLKEMQAHNLIVQGEDKHYRLKLSINSEVVQE